MTHTARLSFEELVDLYLDRCHLGDAPDIAVFAAAHPEHEAELLETLPLLDDLETIGDAARGRAEDELPKLPGSDFTLLRKIGGGGMGVVFEARQRSLDRRVAVKLLAPSLVSDVARRLQFEREARLVATLRHPGIVKVIGAGQCAGTCYYAMEIIDGERLDRHDFGRDLRAIADVGLQAARALAYAHAQQVMHRDIKPSNLLIDKNGAVHIADFGLACALERGRDEIDRPGAQNGTLRYMPAERLIHGISSFLGDQYALGATLYELIARRPILQERSSTRLFRRICTAPVPPLAAAECADRDLAAIVNKCVSFDPRDRYPSMADLAEDLRRFLAHEPISARPVPTRRRFALWVRRKPLVASLAALSLVCAASAMGALAVGYARTADALRRAERNASLADAAMSGIFRGVESQAPSRRDTQLLAELLPYYGELARRQDMPPAKIAEANRVLGTCAFRTGDYALAEKAFRHLPEDLRTAADRNNLADALRRQGRRVEAAALYRAVADAAAGSTNAVDRVEAVRALKTLATDDPRDPDRARAFELLAGLLRESPHNPDYRYQYALVLGDKPPETANPQLPEIAPNPARILSRLADEYPDRPEYGVALINQIERRLRAARFNSSTERSAFALSMERADRLLARYPNMPDVVSAVIRMRAAYADYLRRVGDPMAATQIQARTSGMIEMLSHSPESPASQRFVFTGADNTRLAYRQIVVNGAPYGPVSLIVILHGRQARGSDNFQQLASPALMSLLEYVQTHGERVVALLPQCPAKTDWTKLRPTLDALTQQKANEFRIHDSRIAEIGDAALTEAECAGLFERANATTVP